MKPNVSAYSIGKAKRGIKYPYNSIESDYDKSKKFVPGPGAYLSEIKEKIVLHDGAFKTPGGK